MEEPDMVGASIMVKWKILTKYSDATRVGKAAEEEEEGRVRKEEGIVDFQ